MLFCVTGDLASSGQENQYVAVEIILEEIHSIIQKRFSKVSIHYAFVPGNHDCNFNDEIADVREALLASPTLDIEKTAQLKVCTSIQKKLFQLYFKMGRKA
mgnify:CR=1 FL=1